MLEVKTNNFNRNPNLFVSKTRLRFRNLPKKDFSDNEFKDLLKEAITKYKNSKTIEMQKKLGKEKLLMNVYEFIYIYIYIKYIYIYIVQITER